MTSRSPRFRPIFMEVFESLDRQGPGNRDNARRALELCENLPDRPQVLDLGCGVGTQSLYVAELTGGTVTAVDTEPVLLERFKRRVEELGLSDRIRPVLGDMADLGMPDESVDLVWSEGALYNLGIERALGVCRHLLRPGGYLAFTEAVWTKSNPPEHVVEMFGYPGMGSVGDIVAAAQRTGFDLVGNFPISADAWLDDFYVPMQARIAELERAYTGDVEALAILREIRREPESYREFGSFYDYEFFVLRRPIE